MAFCRAGLCGSALVLSDPRILLKLGAEPYRPGEGAGEVAGRMAMGLAYGSEPLDGYG